MIDVEKRVMKDPEKRLPVSPTTMTDEESAHFTSPTDSLAPLRPLTGHMGSQGPSFPPLRSIPTNKSQASAIRAAQTLSDFESSPDNPRNWSQSKKWRITLTIALTGFISTSGSSIAVPGVHELSDEFGNTNAKVGTLIISMYVLGMGAGPFLFAPLSELYGRQPAYLLSQVLFVLFTIGTALAPNMEALIILRFFCGMWSSSGPGLGVATCADIWKPEERGKPISIYAVGPMAGPVLGSMLGYWILFGGWRWLFWALTLMAFVNLILLATFTRETYAPVLEKILKYQISHPLSDPQSLGERLSPSRMLHDLGWMSAMVSGDEARAVFGRAFSRPPRLLFGNPVAFLFSLYYAYIYGIIYLFLVSVPLMFGSPPFNRAGLFSYQWSHATLSLAYVGLGVGAMIAAVIAATCQDRIYRYLKQRNGGAGQPEYRLVLTQIGMIIMPIGLLIFGWTAQAETHWIGPQFGQVLILLGLTLAFNSIQNFIVDAFFPYSAAAIAGATALRSVIACILPIFSPDLFRNLGWGWGGTLLALVALIAVPAPAVMFVWGRRLREKYKFEG